MKTILRAAFPYRILIFAFLFFCINSSSAQLAIEWQQCVGTTTNETIRSLSQAQDGGYIAGAYSMNDFMLIKTDSLGNQQWIRTYGGTAVDEPQAVIALAEGGFLISGRTLSTDGDVTGNHGQEDGWLVKTDDQGNLIWEKSLGGTENEYIWSMLQIPGGNYLLAATTSSNDGDLAGINLNSASVTWLIELDTAGTIINNAILNGSGVLAKDISPTNDGGYVLTGYSGAPGGIIATNYGGVDLAVVKLDSTLSVQWCKNYGGTSSDMGASVMQTSDNNYVALARTSSYDVYVSGNNGYSDFWVVKMDSMGEFLWQKCLGGSYYDQDPISIYETSSGDYIIAGVAGSTDDDISHPYDGVDFWIACIDTSSALLWEKSLGGGNGEYAGAFIPANDGSFILAGGTYSNDFDVSGHMGAANTLDGWITKVHDHPNMVKGKVFIDTNGNQVYDTGEIIMPLHPVREQVTGRSTITNASGDYILNLPEPGNFIIYCDSIEYCETPLPYAIAFSGTNETDSLNDFAFQPDVTLFDLSISITATGALRPGFTTIFHIQYQNLGSVAISGEINLAFPSLMNYLGASEVPTVILLDSLSWDYTNLVQYESRSIDVSLRVPETTTLSTPITFIAEIQPLAGDVRWFNNRDTINDVIVGSFDPNDIAVDIPQITQAQAANPPFLEYLIRFQNTGTYLATFIEIANPISPWLDINTFELIALSHTGTVNYLQHSRNLDVFFDNINLPDSTSDEAGSHGFVRYRIKPYPGLAIGDTVFNHANIYFDYNAPVITNYATTVVENPLVLQEVMNPGGITIYPNPAMDIIRVKANLGNDTAVRLSIYNILGECVYYMEEKTTKKFSAEIPVENFPSGMYIIELISDYGIINGRFLKER